MGYSSEVEREIVNFLVVGSIPTIPDNYLIHMAAELNNPNSLWSFEVSCNKKAISSSQEIAFATPGVRSFKGMLNYILIRSIVPLRAWCNGSTKAFQAFREGSSPFAR